MDRQVSSMPESDRRVTSLGLGAFMFALAAPAPAAAADQARATLTVQAVVLPACRASATGRGHSVDCSSGTAPEVRVERRQSEPGEPRREAVRREGPTTFVTVTY